MLGLDVSDDQYSLVRIMFQNLSRCIHAIQVRHADIQDQKIWFQLHAFFYGFTPIICLAADFPSCVRSDERRHTHPKNRMVISQQYAKCVHRTSTEKLPLYRLCELWHSELLRSAHNCSQV